MTRIAVILGSTRPGRNGEGVAKWVMQHAAGRPNAQYELVDIAEQGLPFLDEPVPGQQSKEHSKRWSAKIAGFDGFVFVTAEYNHGIPGALKNAIDFLYKDWNDKAAGFVSYGSAAGGSRAVESLRLVMGELHVADVRAQVLLTLTDDFENYRLFKPRPHHEKTLAVLFDEVEAWSKALRTLRPA